MKLDLLTYLFEIINFFVLLWILKKLLYNPVISVLKKRKNYIDQKIREAEEAESKLKKIKDEYNHVLKEIEELKKTKIAQIEKEVQQEKERLYSEMKKELDAQRQKFLESLEIEKKEAINELKEETVRYALKFVSKLLTSISDKNLHKKLLSIALEGIRSINREEIDDIAAELKERNTVTVETAYPLSEDEIESIKKSIKDMFGVNVTIKIEEKNDLIAGVKIHIASKMIDASLEGQISVFETLLRDKIES
ncbi:F0F1 ATP synthase subunit delta [Persephonella sp.]